MKQPARGLGRAEAESEDLQAAVAASWAYGLAYSQAPLACGGAQRPALAPPAVQRPPGHHQPSDTSRAVSSPSRPRVYT